MDASFVCSAQCLPSKLSGSWLPPVRTVTMLPAGTEYSVPAGFAASPHGFIVKGVNVSPAGMTPSMGGPGAFGRGEGGMPGEGYAPPVSPASAPGVGTGKGGLSAFLNEQLLRVTLEVVIVKPLPKK